MSPEGHPDSEWHTIRPWSPHLTLSVREVTSISATFILSSSLSESDPSLLALPNNDHDHELVIERSGAVISDALAKGMSVNVNGSGWQRVIMRMDEAVDQAIIVIYGLMPGRQYDIDLGLVQDGQPSSVKGQITTEGVQPCHISDSSPI